MNGRGKMISTIKVRDFPIDTNVQTLANTCACVGT